MPFIYFFLPPLLLFSFLFFSPSSLAASLPGRFPFSRPALSIVSLYGSMRSATSYGRKHRCVVEKWWRAIRRAGRETISLICEPQEASLKLRLARATGETPVEPSSRGRERGRGKKRGRSAFSTPEVLLKRANSIVNGRPPPRGATRQQRRWKHFFIKIRIQRDTRRILNSCGSIVRAEREVLLDIRILIEERSLNDILSSSSSSSCLRSKL